MCRVGLLVVGRRGVRRRGRVVVGLVSGCRGRVVVLVGSMPAPMSMLTALIPGLRPVMVVVRRRG